jgi:glyoxylase I family protein
MVLKYHQPVRIMYTRMYQANPINIRLIDHVVLRVNDLEKMTAFYCEVLGCRLERGPDTIRLAQLRAGQSLIDLVDVNGPLGRQAGNAPDRNAPNMDHFCLQLEPWDADSILAHLENHNVEMGEIESRYGATGRGPSIYIKDPEGNTVELKGPAGEAT